MEIISNSDIVTQLVMHTQTLFTSAIAQLTPQESGVHHHLAVQDNTADGKLQWIVYEEYFYWLTNTEGFREFI